MDHYMVIGQPWHANCPGPFKISNRTHTDDKYDYGIIYISAKCIF